MNTDQSGTIEKHCRSGLLVISRGTAILLLLVYAAYLFFQLKTHSYLFTPKPRAQSQDEEGAPVETPHEEEEEDLQMAPVAAGTALLLVTVATSFAADYRE